MDRAEAGLRSGGTFDYSPRFLRVVTDSPPIPQLSVSTSSIMTTVVFRMKNSWFDNVSRIVPYGLKYSASDIH